MEKNVSKYDSEIHHRKSIRLSNFDYTVNGAYFITICTHQKKHLFGHIEHGEMILNLAGKIVKQCWGEIPEHYPNVTVDRFVVMPNHVHGIFIINPVKRNPDQPGGAQNPDQFGGAQNSVPLPEREIKRNQFQKIVSGSVGAIVRGYKIGVTKRFRQNTNIETVWQRNYWERIIRDDDEMYKTREYIVWNPKNWEWDAENAMRKKEKQMNVNEIYKSGLIPG